MFIMLGGCTLREGKPSCHCSGGYSHPVTFRLSSRHRPPRQLTADLTLRSSPTRLHDPLRMVRHLPLHANRYFFSYYSSRAPPSGTHRWRSRFRKPLADVLARHSYRHLPGSLLPPFLAHTFCNFMGLPPIDYALRVYPERRASASSLPSFLSICRPP